MSHAHPRPGKMHQSSHAAHRDTSHAMGDWTTATSPDGKTYYYNTKTGFTSWTPPPGFAAPAPAPTGKALLNKALGGGDFAPPPGDGGFTAPSGPPGGFAPPPGGNFSAPPERAGPTLPFTASGNAKQVFDLIIEKNWVTVKAMVTQNPAVAKQHAPVDDYSSSDLLLGRSRAVGCTPLAMALGMNAPNDVIEVLLKAHPKAATEADSSRGELPLHIACKTGGNIAPFRKLLAVFPQACKRADKSGMLPLHVAVKDSAIDKLEEMGGASIDFMTPRIIVQELIRAFPQALSVRDKDGATPIVLAAQVNALQGVFQAIINTPGAKQFAKQAKNIFRKQNGPGSKAYRAQTALARENYTGAMQMLFEASKQ